MLPVLSTISAPAPVQTTFVATPLPDTNALRVPPDNVPPSVSNAQVNNNARDKSGGQVILEGEEAAPAPEASADAEFSVLIAKGPMSKAIGAPATFLAQLIGQSISPTSRDALRGVLAEYEKQASIAYVKYMPSNATLPPPPPTGLFGKMLQQEKSMQPSQVVNTAAPKAEVETVAASSAPAAVQAPRPAARSQASQHTNKKPVEEFAVAPAARPVASMVQAYAVTATRNALIKPDEVPAPDSV